jgi:hypothetical protein
MLIMIIMWKWLHSAVGSAHFAITPESSATLTRGLFPFIS